MTPLGNFVNIIIFVTLVPAVICGLMGEVGVFFVWLGGVAILAAIGWLLDIWDYRNQTWFR